MDKDGERWDAVEDATELLIAGQLEEGLVALREVLRRDPDNAYAFHFIGTAMFELKQLEAARDAYRAALRLSPGYLASRIALSHVLRLLGDAHAALAEANEALQRFPHDGAAQHAAGLASAAVGDRPTARQHLQEFLENGPELEAQLEVQGILDMLGIGDDDEPLDFE